MGDTPGQQRWRSAQAPRWPICCQRPIYLHTQDRDPLDGLADHGQRQRSLPGLALTERDYSVGLNAAKLPCRIRAFEAPFNSPGRPR
jgi:hypothetical protein